MKSGEKACTWDCEGNLCGKDQRDIAGKRIEVRLYQFNYQRIFFVKYLKLHKMGKYDYKWIISVSVYLFEYFVRFGKYYQNYLIN